MTHYDLWLTEDNGTSVALLEGYTNFSFQRTINGKGAYSIEFPADLFPYSDFRLDRQLEVWRTTDNGVLHKPFIGLLQYVEQRTPAADIIEFGGYDVNDILNSRIVYGYAGSALSTKDDYADDMMKDFVRENLGASASATRTRSSALTVADDTSQGPTIHMADAYEDLLQTLQDCAARAFEKGSPVFFDVIRDGASLLNFITYVGQLGVDRTGTNSSIGSLTISTERGTLENPVYREDYRDMISKSIVGGQDTGADRMIVEVEDTRLSNLSLWSLREDFADGRNYALPAQLTDLGYANNFRARPGIAFRGLIADIPGNLYGEQCNFGDRLIAEYKDKSLICDIAGLRVAFNSKGQETIDAHLRYLG